MTPEGSVKAQINRVLKEYMTINAYSMHPALYKFMPVPSGYGPSSLDYIVCYRGQFIAIEAKAPGKQPTPRQHAILHQIQAAGGHTFVIDGENGDLEYLIKLLKRLK